MMNTVVYWKLIQTIPKNYGNRHNEFLFLPHNSHPSNSKIPKLKTTYNKNVYCSRPQFKTGHC